MSVTLLGARWSGPRLRLERAGELGLGHCDLVGWSDFYGGGPCDVQVALASDGRNSGFLVWGGNLGLRVVPSDLFELNRRLGDSLEHRPLLWLPDPGYLPGGVREVVAPEVLAEADRSRIALAPRNVADTGGDLDGERRLAGVRGDVLTTP